MSALAVPLLSSVLSLTGLMDVGLRTEARGVHGHQYELVGNVPTPRKLADPVPYEIDPTVSLALEEPQRYGLRLGYTSRILMLARPQTSEVVSTAEYGTALALVTLQADRLRLDATGTLSRGTLQVTPMDQLANPGETTSNSPPRPPMQNVPVVAVAQHRGESVGLGIAGNLSRGLAIGGAASYSHGGATNPSQQVFFPPQESETAEAHVTFALGAFDNLTLRSKYQRTNVYSFGIGDIVDVGLRWDRTPRPDLTGWVGLGIASTVRSSLVKDLPREARPLFPERTAPFFEAGISRKSPLERPGVGGTLSMAYAPYVDPYSVAVQKRGSVKAEGVWQALTRVKFTAQLGGAALIRDWRPRNGSAAMELAVWYQQPQSDVGLALRGGYNQIARIDSVDQVLDPNSGDVVTPARPAVPAVTYWEWGVSVVAHWGLRTAL